MRTVPILDYIPSAGYRKASPPCPPIRAHKVREFPLELAYAAGTAAKVDLIWIGGHVSREDPANCDHDSSMRDEEKDFRPVRFSICTPDDLVEELCDAIMEFRDGLPVRIWFDVVEFFSAHGVEYNSTPPARRRSRMDESRRTEPF